jgi:hypothetical protein
MVVAVMMVVPAGCKYRACTNQQQERRDDYLLHTLKRSMIFLRFWAPDRSPEQRGIKTATGGTVFGSASNSFPDQLPIRPASLLIFPLNLSGFA